MLVSASGAAGGLGCGVWALVGASVVSGVVNVVVVFSNMYPSINASYSVLATCAIARSHELNGPPERLVGPIRHERGTSRCPPHPPRPPRAPRPFRAPCPPPRPLGGRGALRRWTELEGRRAEVDFGLIELVRGLRVDGNPKRSKVIRGHVRGHHQRQSEVIGGHQRFSEVLSVAIPPGRCSYGHQRSSRVIRVISGNPTWPVQLRRFKSNGSSGSP